MPNILITYATKHGSTHEIAEALWGVLRADGFDVEIHEVEDVKDISAYDAVVLGSAVYMGRWLAPARNFLRRHDKELAQKKVWLFSSGPTGDDVNDAMNEFPEELKGDVERIKPEGVIVFHGKLDLGDTNLFERMIIKAVHAPVGDFRDWATIRDWAWGISEVLNEGIKAE